MSAWRVLTERDFSLPLHALAISTSILAIALVVAPSPAAEPSPSAPPEISAPPPPPPASPVPSLEAEAPAEPAAPSPVAIAEAPSIRAVERPEPTPIPEPPRDARAPRHRPPRPSARAQRAPPDEPPAIVEAPAPGPDPSAGRAAKEKVQRALAEQGIELDEAQRLPAVAAELRHLDDPGVDVSANVIAALGRTTLPDELLKRKLDLLRRDLEAASASLPKERMDRFEEGFLELKTAFSPAIGREARLRLLRDITATRRSVARASAGGR